MEEVIHVNVNDLDKPSFDEKYEYVHTFSVEPMQKWSEEQKAFFETLSNAKTIIVWTS
jgi:hypothetical protein